MAVWGFRRFSVVALCTGTILIAGAQAVVTGGPAGAAATVPSAPTSVVAVGVDGAIDVSWQAPRSSGGSAITGYVVSATRGKVTRTCSSTASRKLWWVVALVNGRSYSVTVKATNAKGSGARSVAKMVEPSGQQNCLFLGPFANLDGCNLAGRQLQGKNLYDAYMANTNLSGANLTNADLYSAYLTDAGLTDATLSGTNLTQAKLTGAELQGATLSRTNLSNADLTLAHMNNVSSQGITGSPTSLPTEWSLVNGYLIGPSADLAGAHLAGADLANAVLSDANFERRRSDRCGPQWY